MQNEIVLFKLIPGGRHLSDSQQATPKIYLYMILEKTNVKKIRTNLFIFAPAGISPRRRNPEEALL